MRNQSKKPDLSAPSALSKTAKVVVLPDMHCPLVQWRYYKQALEIARDFKPNYLVFIGDLIESSAASRWDNEDDWTLEDEFEQAENVLAVAKDACPNATVVLTEGNHDANLGAPNRISKKLRDSVDYKKRLKGLKGVKIVPYIKDPKNVFRLGQLTMFHGWSVARNGDRQEALHMGVPHGLCVRGHTHKPVPVTQVKVDSQYLPFYYANVGTLGPLKPSYMDRKDTKEWGHALLTAEVRLGRKDQNKRNWSAKTHILRMAEGSVEYDFERWAE